MAEGFLSHALSSCIAEGRTPQPQELDRLTDKVLREVFVGDPMRRDHAATIARAALFGNERIR